MKEKILKITKELIPYVIVIVIALFIRTYIASPVRDDGKSMNNTLINGDILILNKLDRSYERFDVVVIDIGETKIIKRIIGLPGESVEYKDNKLYINKKIVDSRDFEYTSDFSLEELYGYAILPNDCYFVIGDNRDNSYDSRYPEIGLIKKNQIKGVTKLRIWPLNKIGSIK